MDIGSLVTAITPLLSPFLPVLLKIGEKATDKLSDAAWELAQRIWHTLEPHFAADSDVKKAAEKAGQRPNDARAVGALEMELETFLTAHPELAKQINDLWQGTSQEVKAEIKVYGDRNIVIGGNVTGSTLISGDENTTQ